MIEDLKGAIRAAIQSAIDSGALRVAEIPKDIVLTPARQKEHGDFATTVALTLQKEAGLPAREVAAIILDHWPPSAAYVQRKEIAGPGFLNFYLKPDWLFATIRTIESESHRYGNNLERTNERVLVEFVSANPTGPISVVNGRAAALGDCLANLLAACGATVEREFYVNDAVNSLQIDLMGQSLAARYMQSLGYDYEVPKDGYLGDYLIDIANEIIAETGDSLAGLSDEARNTQFRLMAMDHMLAKQKCDLANFGVTFDTWFHESSLYADGRVESAVAEMVKLGHAYEKDGAIWLRSSELTGDEQDRVLVRSNDRETYVAADAAYHQDKFNRGFNRLINIWGTDHHGYVKRLLAGVKALGFDESKCEIILTQLIMLIREGVVVRGSKRAGDIVPLSDLVEEVGKDAARYYGLMTSYETTAIFDLELAKKQSSDNPVFYAQYAHARCSGVLIKAEEMGIIVPPAQFVDLTVLTHEKEADLIRKLSEYPEEVRTATAFLAPHRLTTYVREFGQALHQFYENCPALKDGVPLELCLARLTLFRSARTVVRNLLGLLGVSAPDRM